ncbi:aspartyl protease family protein At5g10770-like [Humulus lupulus]|uniref:aspartyl protease family protein At5g10770-like n=1 Tax=Humulus lupulus TaxID=3486 RepID=UPI002B409A06|nr:aspartyl protease family protein At5g10770-like [Humulus lupulus]
MAIIITTSSSSSSSSSSSFLISCFLLLLSCVCVFGLESKESVINSHPHHYTHTLPLNSLFPASTCDSSSTVDNNEATLKVIHKHGPCSPHQAKTDHTQILQQDQYRVNSIRSRLSDNSAAPTARGGRKGRGGGTGEKKDAITLPAKSGAVLGSGNYIVTVGLGTPKKDLSLIFDTGSDITWTQCQPCAKSCYDQKEPIFDPSKSSTYSNVSCTSAECTTLKSATGNTPACSSGSSTCIYGIQYGDQSFSVGYFSKERLTLSSSAVIDNVLFGCGQNNQGLFGGSAGLLGLGRNKLSIVEQTAQKYNRYFSYCLPSTSSQTGYLTLGNAAKASDSVKYTPLSTISGGASFYGLQVLGISVGGKKLPISPSLFQSSGTIIDSGTVITRLPPTAYGAISSEFKKQMSSYPVAPALSILDTCYDLSKYKTVTIPKIAFTFGGGTTVELDSTGILYASKISQVCLAFAANGDDGDVAIFGNVQQKTLQVVYDIGGAKIGFGTRGC